MNPSRLRLYYSSVSLAAAAMIVVIGLFVSGCSSESASSEGEIPTSTESATSPAGADVKGAKQADPGKMVSTIAGDRVQAIPTVTLSKQTESSPFRFAEIAAEAGIDFVHFSGMTEEKHFPTANGSGVAVFDADNDGLLDIYFATATLLPLGTAEKGPNRLYKNLGGNHFKDVTAASGLGYRGFCHGIITGDIDNDGDQDVFLCNYGSNALYLNNGDGSFKDVSKQAGIDAPNWSSGGAMLDYDNDGYLDIYVSNYGRWIYPEDHHKVGDTDKKVWLYSSPRAVKTVNHLLFHNNRNGTFTDVYDRAITVEDVVEDSATKSKKKVRVAKPRDDGHGFGVVTADLNDDGLVDIFVANDMNPNFLFLNNGDGTFDDVSEISGAAYNINGMAQSGMGVDAEDVNGDGLPELFVTNFSNEYSTLYLNYGKGIFYDNTAFFGLASDSMPWVKWGCALSDFDGDGWPDCFFVNGHVDDNRRLIGQPIDYEEIPLLFRNVGGKRFRLSTRDVGTYFDTKHVGRGAAFGDLDNDGDIDIVVNHKDAAPALLRNDTKSGNHWVRFLLQGTKSNRDAIGAKLEVTLSAPDGVVAGAKGEKPGEQTIYRQRKGGYSMQGTNDSRVLVGVGPATTIKKVVIRWPSRAVTTLENLKVDQDYKIAEPKETAPAQPAGANDKPKPAS
jgi:enediyne biosynthesis protein E4